MALLNRITGTIESIRNNIGSGLDHGSSNKSKDFTDQQKIDLELDICCNLNTLRYLNGDSGDDTGYNKRSFTVEGYIYKKGTFDYYGYDSGISPAGSAEFLDRLAGKWICKGWYINKGRDTKTGHYIDSTHTYELDSETALSRILTSNGKEKIDMHEPFNRVLCSGTGGFSRVRGGSAIQTNLGVNSSKGYNFVVKFRFRY